MVPLLMTLKYIWRSFQPRLSFPRPFQQSLACFRVARSPSSSWTSCVTLFLVSVHFFLFVCLFAQPHGETKVYFQKLEVIRQRRPPPNASIIDNPVNTDFGFQTPGSGRLSGCNQLASRSHPILSIKFNQNPLVTFSTIQWMRISDFGLLNPDADPNRHQNWTPWSLGHALPLQEISSKSIHNFFSYPTDRQTNRQTNRPK